MAIYDNGLNPALPGYDPAKVAAANAGSTYAPLPQLNSEGQASYAQPAQNPVDVFNMKLMELLGKAQQANSGNAALAERAGKLQVGGVERSMAPASELGIENLRPGDALAARERESELYNPEVKALNDRMRLNNEAISRFESTIKAAKEWGEEYYKAVKPDEATVQAVQMQMRAGIKPSEAILDKVRTSLTQADWDALAAAGGGSGDKPSSYKEYALTDPTPTPEEYKKFLEGSGPKGPGSTVTERLLTQQQSILASAKSLPKGEDGFANPVEWLNAESNYIGAGGTAAKFIAAVPPEQYLAPGNAEWVRRIVGSTGGAVDVNKSSDNPFE